MMLAIVLVSLATFVSAAPSEPSYSESNPVTGYLTRFAIPEAKRIQKAEEEYLKSQSSRIVGGSPARQGQVPYQAGIIADIIGTSDRAACGASLVSNSRLVTAGRCWFDGEDHAWRFTVVLGSNLLFSGGTRLLTSNVVTHPSYIPWFMLNDIAVIRLNFPVRFTATISPVALPSGAELQEDFAGIRAIASGFGMTSDDEYISFDQYLSYVRVNVIRNQACDFGFPLIRDEHICTSTIEGTGTCTGDAGGPLVVERGHRTVLIGTILFESPLGCASGLPTVYSRVTTFIDFINENL